MVLTKRCLKVQWLDCADERVTGMTKRAAIACCCAMVFWGGRRNDEIS